MIKTLRGSGKKVALLITVIILLLGLTANGAFAYGLYPFNLFSNSGGASFFSGMMGMMGGGMMGGSGYGYGQTPPADPIDIEKADAIFDGYLTAIGDPKLKLAEIMEFDNHFYAELQEKDTGKYALELILNKYTGAIYPEMGPNMMWNEKYGQMGGMMGWGYGIRSTQQKITPDQALSNTGAFWGGDDGARLGRPVVLNPELQLPAFSSFGLIPGRNFCHDSPTISSYSFRSGGAKAGPPG